MALGAACAIPLTDVAAANPSSVLRLTELAFDSLILSIMRTRYGR